MSLRLFGIVLLIRILHCSTLLAWGHATHLNSEWGLGSLAYVVRQNSSIYFCVQSNDKKNFPEKELALQTREALRIWLLSAKLKSAVKIQRLECSDSKMNLKVRLGPEKHYKQFSAYEIPQVSERGYYSLIQLNTSYRHDAHGKKYKIISRWIAQQVRDNKL